MGAETFGDLCDIAGIKIRRLVKFINSSYCFVNEERNNKIPCGTITGPIEGLIVLVYPPEVISN